MLTRNTRAIVTIFAVLGALPAVTYAGVMKAGSREWRLPVVTSENGPWRRVEVVETNLSKPLVTIRHDGLTDLHMPAMIMRFAPAESTHLAMLLPGDHIDVQIVAHNGGQIVGFRMLHGSGDLFT